MRFHQVETPPAFLTAKIIDKATGARVYLYNNRGDPKKPGAKVYLGKQGKPAIYNWYAGRDPLALREAAVKRLLEAHARALADKAERQAARKAFVNPYKVGDIFATHWGYEQTNVDYYECVAVKGQHLIVREIAGEEEPVKYGADAGHVVPVPGAFKGPERRYLAQEGGFRVASYAFARYLEPKLIAGCRVYEKSYVSHYG